MKKYLPAVFLLLFYNPCIAQIVYGANNYTEYHPGTLPFVFSVPHGGSLNPSSIPDRTCNNPTLVSDANTIELAMQIDTGFFNLTGCHPHIIYCNLKRTKLDCNRNLADGACGNADAITAWIEFNHFIDSSQAIAQSQNNGVAFYIDLHGHGHTVQQLELGYLYYDTELALSDSMLNTPLYMSYNSIQNLVANNINGYTNAEMLRGPFALGTLLGNAGYPSVPSFQTPAPGTNPYFSGGYNTANHTSYAANNSVNGLQIECNYTNVRDTYLNRKIFADSLASVLVQYLLIHQGVNFSNCNINGVDDLITSKKAGISPTILDGNGTITVIGLEVAGNQFIVTNGNGQEVVNGIINQENKLQIPKTLSKGMYILTVNYKTKAQTFRFLVQ